MLKVIENKIKWEWQWLKTTLFRSVYNTYALYVKIKLGEILITDQVENLTQSTKFETNFSAVCSIALQVFIDLMTCHPMKGTPIFRKPVKFCLENPGSG